MNFNNAIRTLEERYAIKFCFKLVKNATETYGMLAWIEHEFLNGIRDSRKVGSQWGMMTCVGGVRTSIQQSWLAKGLSLGLGLLCWGLNGLQGDIQIGSRAFPAGQCTGPQLHPCHRLSDQDGHQDSSLPSYSPDLGPCDFWLFPKLRDCHYAYLPTPPLGQDMTQGQFLSGV